MFLTRRVIKTITCIHHLSVFARSYQVTVVGALSDVGQSLSLMLRSEPSISRVVIHDIKSQATGVLLDLKHIPAWSCFEGFFGVNTLDKALRGADIIIATDGNVSTSDNYSTHSTILGRNTNFMKYLCKEIGKLNPMPFVGIATEPLNTILPMAAELIRSYGYYDQKKLFGITTVDTLRAQTIYAAGNNLDTSVCFTPVIGGHSSKTMVPLLTKSEPFCPMDDEKIRDLSEKIRKSDKLITDMKKGWHPSSSVAYGALLFTRKIVEALNGQQTQVTAYIENNDFGTGYFSGLLELDHNGVREMVRFPELTQFECCLLESSITQLRKDISDGIRILEVG